MLTFNIFSAFVQESPLKASLRYKVIIFAFPNFLQTRGQRLHLRQPSFTIFKNGFSGLLKCFSFYDQFF